MNEESKWYAVVTCGSPSVNYRRVHKDKGEAIETACRIKGTGSCTNARVMGCDTRKLARSADISEVRDGEWIVYGG